MLAISLLASLHVSSNQGASVLPHLLGFLGAVILISLTTPAATAYSSINFSTSAALSSLFISLFPTKVLNFSKNAFFPVNSDHDYADLV
jgi:hypothetical protein